MEIQATAIPGVLIVQPKVLGDARGFFVETWAADRYEAVGISGPFVQDNASRSGRHTLRGMHLQHPNAQGKLVSVMEGTVLDVALDVRVGSPTFGQHVAVELRAEDHRQLWIPSGFAHGFYVTSEHATFTYKCTERYAPEDEIGIAWNDPHLGIAWPTEEPTLSSRDRAHARLRDIPPSRLPQYVG